MVAPERLLLHLDPQHLVSIVDLNLLVEIRGVEAEMIRLAVDQLLERYEDDPDGVLLELYHQQQAELRLTEKRKHAPSRGLAEYLKRRGLL